MTNSRLTRLCVLVVVLSGCGLLASCGFAKPERPSALDADVVPYDATVGNVFAGRVEFDDDRVRALPPSALPATGSALAPQRVTVERVIDGDTIDVVPQGGGDSFRVRLIGVDTPEVSHRDATQDTPDCYGKEAFAFSELLRNRTVWLTFDQGMLDNNGRTLAYVWIGAGEGDLWQRQLVRRGLATTLTIAPNDHFAAMFEADELAAQSANVGLWADCP